MFWLSNGWQLGGKPGAGTFDLVTELSTRLREAENRSLDGYEVTLV